MNQDTGSHTDVALLYIRIERRILVTGERVHSQCGGNWYMIDFLDMVIG